MRMLEEGSPGKEAPEEAPGEALEEAAEEEAEEAVDDPLWNQQEEESEEEFPPPPPSKKRRKGKVKSKEEKLAKCPHCFREFTNLKHHINQQHAQVETRE